MAGPVKNYGNGTPGITFNNSLDLSELENTCEGVTSGEYTGEGTSMPPSRIWNDGRPYFPPQNDFWGVSTVIKPPGSDFSMMHRTLAEFPLTYNNISSGFTNRSEFSTEHSIVTRSKQAFRISVYIPDITTISASGGTSPRRHLIFQTHTLNSPGFAIYIDRYGFIMISLNKGADGSAGQVYIPIKPIVKNTWMHFTVFMEYIGSYSGRCVIWDDRVLARTYRLSGSTYVPDIYPVQTGGSSNIYTLNNSIHGRLPEVKNVSGNNVNLFNWYGYTLPIGSSQSQDPTEITQKWGWYCHEWNGYYRPVSEAQSRFESGLYDGDTQRETAANCIMKNPDNPGENSTYIHPDDREKVLYTVTRFTHWDETDTDQAVFERLHPEGLSPLEVPMKHTSDGTPVFEGGVHAQDFTWNEVEGPFNLTLSKNIGTGDPVTRDPASGDIADGDPVTLTAPEIEGYVFNSWQQVHESGPNTFLSNQNPYIHTMNSDISIRAVYLVPSGNKKIRMRVPKQTIS